MATMIAIICLSSWCYYPKPEYGKGSNKWDNELMKRSGYCLPCQMNIRTRYRLYPHERDNPDLINQPLDVALRLHCPPSFLKIVLEEYQHHNLDIKGIYRTVPVQLTTWAGNSEGDRFEWHFQRTNLGNMTWNLFRDMFDPSISWK